MIEFLQHVWRLFSGALVAPVSAVLEPAWAPVPANTKSGSRAWVGLRRYAPLPGRRAVGRQSPDDPGGMAVLCQHRGRPWLPVTLLRNNSLPGAWFGPVFLTH